MTIKDYKAGVCPLLEFFLPTPMDRAPPHLRHAWHVGDINSVGVTCLPNVRHWPFERVWTYVGTSMQKI